VPRSGTGVYTLPAASGSIQNGQTANATDVMTVLNDIATAMTASTANDGQTKITGDWDFQTYDLTNIGVLGVTSNATIGGTATITGAVTMSSTVAVTGKSTLGDAVSVSKGGIAVVGNSAITGTLGVSGAITAANGAAATQVVTYGQFPVTLGTTGAQGLPGGKLEKWGTGSTTLGSGTVTFGTAFPTSCDNVQLSISGGSKATTINPLIVGTVTKAGFDVWGDSGQSLTFYWHAIGQ